MGRKGAEEERRSGPLKVGTELIQGDGDFIPITWAVIKNELVEVAGSYRT